LACISSSNLTAKNLGIKGKCIYILWLLFSFQAYITEGTPLTSKSCDDVKKEFPFLNRQSDDVKIRYLAVNVIDDEEREEELGYDQEKILSECRVLDDKGERKTGLHVLCTECKWYCLLLV